MRCGPGADVVNADLTDSVASDCELVGRRLSRDPYTTADAQHETEVEPDSFTFGRTTVAAFQVGRRFSGAADNVGFAVSTERRDDVAQRAPSRPDRREQPGGPARARERPGRRLRRRTRHLADLDARARAGTTTRLAVSRSADGSRGATPVVAAETRRARESPSTRTGSSATTPSRRRSRPLLPRLHRTLRPRHARGHWSDDGGSPGPCPSDIGARPAVGASRRSVRRASSSSSTSGRRDRSGSPRRARPTAARRGARPSDRRRRQVRARSAAFAHSRCPLPSRAVGARLGRLARLRSAGRTGEHRLRRDLPRRGAVDRAEGGDAGRDAFLPGDRNRPGDGPSGDRVHARRARRESTSSSSSHAGRRRASAPREGSRPSRCPSRGCRERHRGACSPTTSRSTTRAPARSSCGCSHPSPSARAFARRSTRRGLEPYRVPDGLELEKSRDLPRALHVGGWSGRRVSRSPQRRARARPSARRCR